MKKGRIYFEIRDDTLDVYFVREPSTYFSTCLFHFQCVDGRRLLWIMNFTMYQYNNKSI